MTSITAITKGPQKDPAPLSLTPTTPDNLTVYANPNDVRRDLHTFVGYVRGRDIKRSYRGNELPQADYKRLARLIQDNAPPSHGDGESDDDTYYSRRTEAYGWIDYVDGLARRMGFVSYDTKGEYRGYSSAEPSFADNVMRFNADAYRAFLALPLAEQERRLLDTLADDYGSGSGSGYSDYGSVYNEFYTAGIRGRLDRFPNWGGATGVMPRLDFGAIRRFLLELLQNCAPGVWYRTSDLVAYLKANYPYFLIPEKPAPAKAKRPLQVVENRYGNFHEYKDAYYYNQTPIPDDVPDGFERVEGRYVERFLEGFPLTLGYVEVAYADRSESSAKPSRDLLRAFRINERLLQALSGDILQPKVTVQPNFEIYIESVFYPASLVSRLSPLADIVREDTTTILVLRKQKVAAQLAENAGLDVIALLTNLTGQDLPQNVSVELQDWAGQAEVFTLYDGFGLVESEDQHTVLDPFTVEKIGDSMLLARDPGAAFARLMESGAVPLRVRHAEATWEALPAKARTVFPRDAAPARVPKKGAKQAVTIQRATLVALSFPDDALFETFRKALLDARCVLDVDKEKRALTLAGKDEARIKAIIKSVSGEYAIRVEDRA